MSRHFTGVFDSGLGGLTVLHALRGQLPHEDFFYFADTHYLPYGDRPESFLRARGLAIAQGLVALGAKSLVIACNTATAAAAEAIRAGVNVPVVAMEPGVKPAVALSRTGRILVLATRRTVDSPRFAQLVQHHAEGLQVIPQACPGLAEAIETHGPESLAVARLLDQFVLPWADENIDVCVLGCTHYPWVAAAIAARLPSAVRIIDTGEAVARQWSRQLAAHQALGQGSGRLRLATSGQPGQVQQTVQRLSSGFFSQPLSVEHWEP